MIDIQQIKSGSYLECSDGSRFIVRNGKLFGPTAWISITPQWYIKYQANSFEAVIQEIHQKHVITKVVSNRLKVLLRMIHFEINF